MQINERKIRLESPEKFFSLHFLSDEDLRSLSLEVLSLNESEWNQNENDGIKREKER